MKKTFKTTLAQLVLALAMIATATWAQAITAFEPAQNLSGTNLVLNDAGTRYRTIFKAYDMGLYLKTRTSSVRAIVDLPGPKRVSFVALRELPGSELGSAFYRGLEANSAKALINKHVTSSLRLVEIFSGKSKILAGEAFAMEYVPGKGTQFIIDGKTQGAPIGDSEFFSMILMIWLGDSPADWKLKDALLGQSGG